MGDTGEVMERGSLGGGSLGGEVALRIECLPHFQLTLLHACDFK